MSKTTKTTSSNGHKTTTCPVSREQFLQSAQDQTIQVQGQIVQGEGKPKEFSTGSFGWNINGKVTLIVDGVPVKCQVSGNVIVVGSKELPK